MQRFAHQTGWAAVLVVLLLGFCAGKASAKQGASFDASVVRRGIYRDLPKINRCYQSALRYEPELAGKVAVKFAVARRGDVRDVQVVQNTTGNQDVGRCVTRVVSQIRFKPRRSGKNLLRFTFPFVFTLQD